MTKQEIFDNNKKIAEFMGYIYFEPSVLVDWSDCGGLYSEINVYSKVPILVNDYGDGEKYFSKISNPDYKNENNPTWNNNIEKLDWSTINYDKYLHDLKYNESWDALIPVVEKIEKMDYGFKMCRKVVEVYIDSTKEVILKTKESCRMDSLYKSVIEFIKLYNEKIFKK